MKTEKEIYVSLGGMNGLKISDEEAYVGPLSAKVSEVETQ
jgi:hypothetical protein